MKIEAKDKMVREKARENKKSKLNSDFSVMPVSDKISKEKIGYSKLSKGYCLLMVCLRDSERIRKIKKRITEARFLLREAA